MFQQSYFSSNISIRNTDVLYVNSGSVERAFTGLVKAYRYSFNYLPGRASAHQNENLGQKKT